MHSTYQKGQIASLKVQQVATEKGYLVSLPTVEARYDLIIDTGDKLYRAQIKYVDGTANSGSAQLDLRKETRNNGKKRIYTSDEIDCILAYIPKVDKVCWIGPNLFEGKKKLNLRYAPSKSNSEKNYHFVDKLEW